MIKGKRLRHSLKTRNWQLALGHLATLQRDEPDDSLDGNIYYNMTLDERVQRLENSWGKSAPLVCELRDAVMVTAELENRQGKILKDALERIAEHNEWAQHTKRVAEHEVWFARHEAAMKVLDERIATLVSVIGELIRKEGRS
jgi:hypothetical protein